MNSQNVIGITTDPNGSGSELVDIRGTPSRVTAKGNNGRIEFDFPGTESARLQGNQPVTLVCNPGQETAYDSIFRQGENRWQFNSFAHDRQYMITIERGQCELQQDWDGVRTVEAAINITPQSNSEFECYIQEFRGEWIPHNNNSEYAESPSFDSWCRNYGLNDLKEADRLALYVTWSAVVNPDGNLMRPAMLMSKNWMNSFWSWDNCFNALAISGIHPQLAWDQLMLPFEYQTPHGSVPDTINDSEITWNFVKPPVEGWTLSWIMERMDWIGCEELGEIYEPLQRWTNWWFNYRDDDDDGIPQYNHGNECADNASCFGHGLPIEAPGLPALLVIQMEVLADIAGKLGRNDSATRWIDRADDLLDRLLDHSWTGDRFIAPQSGTHEIKEGTQSLVNVRPLILGDRLPNDIWDCLVNRLRDKHLTQYGLASESPESQYYKSDGYWLGPIWAPVTMLITDGLLRGGETELATEIAHRFCRTAAEHGMAENFDALSGNGLRDPAHTWTASVYLVLRQEFNHD
ncbi:amylo-alpha-1,6-glucosidase [Halocatena marina]|uniref:amylo-alpha-1,6-glucosidase n=1 Tax=Halocatena marina TaxID=2934937 RepID=UPI0020100029|nr:trehalase family glycosidase [Halocatena marina]